VGDATLGGFVDLVVRQGAAGLFAVFVWALLKGWFVTGEQYRQAMADAEERYEKMAAEKDRQVVAAVASRDRWERIALQALNVAEATAATVHKE